MIQLMHVFMHGKKKVFQPEEHAGGCAAAVGPQCDVVAG